MNRNNKKQQAWLAYMIANVALHGWSPVDCAYLEDRERGHHIWGIASNVDRLVVSGRHVMKVSFVETHSVFEITWEEMPIVAQRLLLSKWREFYEQPT